MAALALRSSVALIALALSASGALAQASVGKAGAVNPATQSAPPGAGVRTMQIGANVVHRERVTTSASGNVQLVFVDRTTLSVGPNSNMVIDEFVYNPAANTGRMAATLTKGVMRFVGGQTSHSEGATIKTPATTLGVRGGVVTVSHDPAVGTRIINHFGRVTVETANGPVVIRRPGYALTIANGSTREAAPIRAARQEIDGNLRKLTSTRGQVGGRIDVPTDQGFSRLAGATNQRVPPTLVEGQRQTTAQGAQLVSNPPLTPPENPIQFVVDSVVTAQQDAAVQQETVVPPPVVVPPVVPPPAGALPPRRFFALAGAPASGGLRPAGFPSPSAFSGTAVSSGMIPAGFAPPGAVWRESGVLGFGAGGASGTTSTGAPAPNTLSTVMAAGISINGQGTAQTSAVYLVTGDLFAETNGLAGSGRMAGSTRRAANAGSGHLVSGVTPTTGGVVFDGNFTPTSVTVDQTSVAGGARVPGSTGVFVPAPGVAPQTYSYINTATTAATPAGLGDNRPTATLQGFAGGMQRTDSMTGAGFAGPASRFLGVIEIALTESPYFTGRITGSASPSGPPSTQNDYIRSTRYFGAQAGGASPNSAYIDYSNFGAQNAVSAGGASLSQVFGRDGAAQNLRTVNSETGLLVTSSVVDVASAFPGVAFCQCDFTRWGFWSSDTEREGRTSSGGVDTVRDRLHLGTWVAGQATPAVSVPTVGTATFAGHAIGSINTGAAEYIAAGNFGSTVNFGANTGTFSVSGLDGRNYAGAMSIAASNRQLFSGGTAGFVMQGQFMNGVAGPAGEMGGAFLINTPGYNGSGTFAARR